jgi:hypothetical protein
MRSIAWSIAGTWQPSPELSLSPFLTPTCFTCGYMVYTESSCGWLVRIGMKNGREQEDGRRKKKEGRNYRICSGGWGGPGVWTGEIEKRMCPLVVYFAGLVESFSMLLETGRMCVCVWGVGQHIHQSAVKARPVFLTCPLLLPQIFFFFFFLVGIGGSLIVYRTDWRVVSVFVFFWRLSSVSSSRSRLLLLRHVAFSMVLHREG